MIYIGLVFNLILGVLFFSILRKENNWNKIMTVSSVFVAIVAILVSGTSVFANFVFMNAQSKEQNFYYEKQISLLQNILDSLNTK